MSRSCFDDDKYQFIKHYLRYFSSSGELIGISYLYNQSGQTLQDFPVDLEPDGSEDLSIEEEEEEDMEIVEEEFDGFLLDSFDPSQQPPPLQPVPSTELTPEPSSGHPGRAVSSFIVCTVDHVVIV